MRLLLVSPGAQLAPIPYETRRYFCRDAEHAKELLDKLQPDTGEGYAAWRIATPDYEQWSWVFCTEAIGPERDDLIAYLDEQATALGGRRDPTFTSDEAALFVKRRLAVGFQVIDGQRPKHTHETFASARVIDPATGDMIPQEEATLDD